MKRITVLPLPGRFRFQPEGTRAPMRIKKGHGFGLTGRLGCGTNVMITKQDLKEVEEYLDNRLSEGPECFEALRDNELTFEPFGGPDGEAALWEDFGGAS